MKSQIKMSCDINVEDVGALAELVNAEISEIYDPYVHKFTGESLTAVECIVLRSYIMGKLAGKLGDKDTEVSD